MARKKRRRKPGLQRCSNCGEFQLPEELHFRICLICLGQVAVKTRRPARAPGARAEATEEPSVMEATSI